MRFIDTVTIFHKEKQDTYSRQVIKGCFWYGDNSISISGNGVIHDNVIHVFFPCAAVKEHGLKVYNGDRIVKGEVPMIKSVNDLMKYGDKITVTGVNEYMVGSPLDNILVSGK